MTDAFVMRMKAKVASFIHPSNIPLTADVHNRIFAEEPYRLNEGWTIETNGAPLMSERSRFNAFVFSCALLRRNHEILTHGRQFKSDARYFIKNPLIFADAVARELKVYLDAAMQDAHMPQSARKKLHLLEVLPVFGLVSYTSASKDQYVTHENLEKFQPKQLRLDPFFRKSSAFQCEKEFRFIWIINLGRMENNDFDLTSTALRTVDLKGIAVPISRKPFSLEGIYDRRGTRIA